ncbi:MAG TPA: polyprenyl synthetase family protein [Gemmatimonadales bacterium]|nr:polyprenyl synthetase family protein [Gemmatimonadales bacterium]
MTSGTAPVSLADLQTGIEPRLGLVREEIRRLIEADFPLIAQINSHLTQMQGKMFRPTLLLLAEAATAAEPDARSVSLAAVVELIHLATLVHDDAVDHSVLRRGMPTLNALFSHQIAVIMGDYLYSRAVIELVRLADLEALRVLSRVTNEMTVGEMRQLLSHDPLAFAEEDYDLLIRAKTASLISGACEVGGLGGTAAEREAIRRFGEGLGMAFQIIDDLLDFTGAEAITGKPAGLDLREHKVTLPLIYALPRMSAFQRLGVESLMNNPEPSEAEITTVVAAVAECGGLDYARMRAQGFCASAEAALESLRPSPAREQLRASLAYVLERSH